MRIFARLFGVSTVVFAMALWVRSEYVMDEIILGRWLLRTSLGSLSISYDEFNQRRNLANGRWQQLSFSDSSSDVVTMLREEYPLPAGVWTSIPEYCYGPTYKIAYLKLWLVILMALAPPTVRCFAQWTVMRRGFSGHGFPVILRTHA